MQTLTARNTPEGVHELLQRVVNAVAGREADPTGGLVQALQLRMGMALLSRIKIAFEEKSQGQMGEDGITWKKLSPVTIAQRRLGHEDRKAVTVKARALGLSAADQKEMAKEITTYTSTLMVKFGIGHGTASGLARSHVENRWRTKIKVFGKMFANDPNRAGYGSPHNRPAVGSILYKFAYLSTRHVLILEDSGELHRAFSPGVGGGSGGDGNILMAQKGAIVVGVSKKPWHHHGSKDGKLPSRPYWPRNGALPDSWWKSIIDAGETGLTEIIAYLVKNRRAP